ncbi:NAD(P)-dependent oxidoreductase [Streptomyces sp. NPDC093970]|uniref:NAD(P)-dependent oxidoreductase n=1 Tax=Streptomyces sp. NPDC093970 TaxID=3155076 RepID=UPI003417E384
MGSAGGGYRTGTDADMTTIGFIGLGTMGAPMARNLLAAGFDVVGYNRSPARAQEFADAGGRRAASVADAAAGSEVVVTMLPDSPDVLAVYTGEEGILRHARPGTLLIDMSSVRPDAARSIGAAAEERDLTFIDAPVSGGERGAKDGRLSVMAGGSPAAFAAARPILEAVGAKIVHVGPVGAGQTVKAANQVIVAGTIQLVAEALTFLRASGADLDAAVEVLSGGLADSAVLRSRAPAMLARDFTPGFRVELHHKDLGIFHDEARAAGVASPVAAAVGGLMGSLHAQGFGGLDHSALLLLVEQLSGMGSAETSSMPATGSAR